MPNAEERETHQMVRDHHKQMLDMEKRLKALEDAADDKEGAPKVTAERRAMLADKHAQEIEEKKRSLSNARENTDQMLENNLRPADEQAAATDSMPKELKRSLEPSDPLVTAESGMALDADGEPPHSITREQVDPPKRASKK